jgi:hypothetical protein
MPQSLSGQTLWLDESVVRHSDAAANAIDRLLHSTRSHLHFTGVNGQIAEFGWQIGAVSRGEMRRSSHA